MSTVVTAAASAAPGTVPVQDSPALHSTLPAASIPFRPAEDGGLAPAGSSASWFLLILLLLIAAALLLKRRLRPGPHRTGLLEVTERCALTSGTQLVVTRYAGRRLLLSVGPAGTQLLRDDAEAETSK